LNNKIPIWLSEGNNESDIINNQMLIKRTLNRYSKSKKIQTYKPVKIVLKSQHGFGPDYKDEKLFV